MELEGLRSVSVTKVWVYAAEFLTKRDHAKSSISWDTTPCSPVKVNRRFEEHVTTIKGRR
jgi:hypothetical protein